MGRTSQPLRIAVWGPWLDRPEVRALVEKGHTIVETETLLDPMPDLILHPRAHRWEAGWWDEPTYLAAALTRARREKKETKHA